MGYGGLYSSHDEVFGLVADVAELSVATMAVAAAVAGLRGRTVYKAPMILLPQMLRWVIQWVM